MSHCRFYSYRHDRDCATRQCRQPRCYGGAGRVPLCTAEECRSKLADFDVRRGQPHRRQLMGKRLKQVVPDNVTRSGDCGVSPIQVEGPRRLGGGATTLVLMISILASLREQAAPDHTCLWVFDLLVVNVNYSGTETSPGLVPRIRDEAGALSLYAQVKESVTPTQWLPGAWT